MCFDRNSRMAPEADLQEERLQGDSIMPIRGSRCGVPQLSRTLDPDLTVIVTSTLSRG